MRLTKNEKKILAGNNKRTGEFDRPADMPEKEWAAALYSLERKGILTARHPFREKWETNITESGKIFLAGNPELKNRLDWDFISRIISIATLVAAVLAMFVGCVRLFHS